MKRSSFPRRKQALRALSRNPVSVAKKKAWQAFSRWVRLRDALETTGTRTHARCCTCGRLLPITGQGCIQAGHYKPGRHKNILFDEHMVHAQCPRCNKWGHGMEEEYAKFLFDKYGADELHRLRARAMMKARKGWAVYELRAIQAHYEAQLALLGGWEGEGNPSVPPDPSGQSQGQPGAFSGIPAPCSCLPPPQIPPCHP